MIKKVLIVVLLVFLVSIPVSSASFFTSFNQRHHNFHNLLERFSIIGMVIRWQKYIINPINQTQNQTEEICKAGQIKYYSCPDGHKVKECVCKEPCNPICKGKAIRRFPTTMAILTSGWYDCKGNLIKEASCQGHEAICKAVGTKSEGWYDSATNELIKWEKCSSPSWDCVSNPEKLCLGHGFCYTSSDCKVNEKCQDNKCVSETVSCKEAGGTCKWKCADDEYENLNLSKTCKYGPDVGGSFWRRIRIKRAALKCCIKKENESVVTLHNNNISLVISKETGRIVGIYARNVKILDNSLDLYNVTYYNNNNLIISLSNESEDNVVDYNYNNATKTLYLKCTNQKLGLSIKKLYILDKDKVKKIVRFKSINNISNGRLIQYSSSASVNKKFVDSDGLTYYYFGSPFSNSFVKKANNINGVYLTGGFWKPSFYKHKAYLSMASVISPNRNLGLSQYKYKVNGLYDTPISLMPLLFKRYGWNVGLSEDFINPSKVFMVETHYMVFNGNQYDFWKKYVKLDEIKKMKNNPPQWVDKILLNAEPVSPIYDKFENEKGNLTKLINVTAETGGTIPILSRYWAPSGFCPGSNTVKKYGITSWHVNMVSPMLKRFNNHNFTVDEIRNITSEIHNISDRYKVSLYTMQNGFDDVLNKGGISINESWYTHNISGQRKRSPETDAVLSYQKDVSNPEVRKFIVDQYMDIIKTYNLDYIYIDGTPFFPYIDWKGNHVVHTYDWLKLQKELYEAIKKYNRENGKQVALFLNNDFPGYYDMAYEEMSSYDYSSNPVFLDKLLTTKIISDEINTIIFPLYWSSHGKLWRNNYYIPTAVSCLGFKPSLSGIPYIDPSIWGKTEKAKRIFNFKKEFSYGRPRISFENFSKKWMRGESNASSFMAYYNNSGFWCYFGDNELKPQPQQDKKFEIVAIDNINNWYHYPLYLYRFIGYGGGVPHIFKIYNRFQCGIMKKPANINGSIYSFVVKPKEGLVCFLPYGATAEVYLHDRRVKSLVKVNFTTSQVWELYSYDGYPLKELTIPESQINRSVDYVLVRTDYSCVANRKYCIDSSGQHDVHCNGNTLIYYSCNEDKECIPNTENCSVCTNDISSGARCCINSDGGKDVSTPGSCRDNNVPLWSGPKGYNGYLDFCINDSYLEEYYCTSRGTCGSMDVECPKPHFGGGSPCSTEGGLNGRCRYSVQRRGQV